MRLRVLSCFLFCVLVCGAELLAANEDGVLFFESNIRPVLIEHCYECHSLESGKSKGGLLLDSRSGLREGGKNGPAVVPGDPDASLLFTAITHADPDLEMPPKKAQLPRAVIADFEAWIRQGAPDPRDGDSSIAEHGLDLEEAREFWAFQKPVRRSVESSHPKWAKRELDHYIRATLDENGLAPRPDAEPNTLLRRLHFDLVGLPPSPEALKRFLVMIESEGVDRALEHEVDALLASPSFGERWGRHWLDVARYAESSGKETNVSFPYAWRYRDYVIDAFNADRPFDRFLTEQIAGDLLPADDDPHRAELMIATGFLAIGPKGLNESNPHQFLADVIDEQIDTVSKAFMGMTVACARCHDHKFDPFTMEDYYALAGIFYSSDTFFGTSVAPGNQVGGDLLHLPELEHQLVLNKPIPEQRLAKLKAELAELKKQEQAGKAMMSAAGKDEENLEEVMKMVNLADVLRAVWRKGAIEGQLKTVDDYGRPLPLAMGVADRPEMRDAPLLTRGDVQRPEKEVARRFPEVMKLSQSPTIGQQQSGRLELAAWLTHPDHPLTSRVMVNRVWGHLFGAGLVTTMENFGKNGEQPTHPELLDHLSLLFVDGGWSVKALIREVVLSRTYRQASTYDEAAFQKDPENRWLWRANPRRLEAEAIRDAMLFVSGNLESKRPDGSLVARLGDRPISIIGFNKQVPSDLDGSYHRSVYLPVLRDRLPDVLDLFDFAEPSLVTGARDTTNVPLQALYLMNSSFVVEQAEGLADRVGETKADLDEQIRHAFLHCFSREPEAEELAIAKAYLSAGDHRWSSFCQSLISTAEFRNVD